jgi:SulP family sulfate permease
VRPKGVLWFASARALEDKFVSALAEHPEAEALVVHLDGLGRIDLTGALALKALLDDARAAGLELEVEGPPPHALPLLRRVFPEHVP